eukprot:scaffold14015_cov112-Isochrysis_galbana.AAC.4
MTSRRRSSTGRSRRTSGCRTMSADRQTSARTSQVWRTTCSLWHAVANHVAPFTRGLAVSCAARLTCGGGSSLVFPQPLWRVLDGKRVQLGG